MIGFLVRTVINAFALLAIAQLSHDAIAVHSFASALLVAVVLGVANATVKPVLLAISRAMTCVLTCLTLGLWSLVLSFLVNGLVFWATAQFDTGLKIRDNDFMAACWAALALACVNSLTTVLTRRENETR